MQIITLIGIIAGTITGMGVILGFLIKLVKPIGRWFDMKVEKIARYQDEKILKDIYEAVGGINQQISNINENILNIGDASREQLKNFLNNIYYKYLPDKAIPIHDKETVIEFYKSYKALGGNGKVKEKYNEMMSWEVKES